MLRIPFLRNLMLLVLVIITCMPLYTLLVLHPAYHEQLVRETESEAVRFVTYLVSGLHIDGIRLDRTILPDEIHELQLLIRNDRQLTKLRFFSPEGEIIYSTESAEIGKANTKEYFRTVVAQGQIYSQVVNKDHQTAEGVVTKLDVVETYVPLWVDGRFGGAVEVYSDITERMGAIHALTVRSTAILVTLSLCFLLIILVALNKACHSLEERDQAEKALREMNEALEARVASRTAELSEANERLIDEVAERTQAQSALSQALEDSRRDREKLDGILRSVNDGLIVTDYKLAILHMNTAAERLLDLPLEKALGQPLDRLGGASMLTSKVRSLLVAPKAATTFDFEVPGDNPRQPRVYQARLSRMESDHAHPGVVLLVQEVTRERELERMKNAFLGMAAHELNTPLAAILGFSELLVSQDEEMTFSAEQQAEYLQLVHSKALELSRLVDDLLDISRVEAGQTLILDYEDVEVDTLLHDVLRPYQEKHARHSFELSFATAQTVIRADHGRIRQVLNNLISNAVKYSPQGGVIRVAVEGGGQRCRLSVADQGIGMTPEQVEHIFDKFYRADSSNTAVQGVGLGMSIVRHIIQAHHGEIRVESQPGRGTTIRVDLPVTPPAA